MSKEILRFKAKNHERFGSRKSLLAGSFTFFQHFNITIYYCCSFSHRVHF